MSAAKLEIAIVALVRRATKEGMSPQQFLKLVGEAWLWTCGCGEENTYWTTRCTRCKVQRQTREEGIR